MKYSLLCLFLCCFLLSNGQFKRDERRLTFLLNLEVDSLCIDCAYQDCRILLYNAHLFKNLEYLEMKNYNAPKEFHFIKYFRKLMSLKLINPEAFDFQKEVFKTKKILRLKELYLWSDKEVKLYSIGIGYYRRRNFFKKLARLRVLVANNVDIGLANDIKMLNNISNLKVLRLTKVGVTLQHFEKVKKKYYHILEVSEHDKEINYNINFGKSHKRKRYWSKRDYRYNFLFLSSVPSLALKSSVIPLQSRFYYGGPEIEFSRPFYLNSEYNDWFEFYRNTEIEEGKALDSLQVKKERFTYFGKLKVGSTDDKFYSLAYKYYDSFLTSYDFHLWDTTSALDRMYSLKYAHDDLIPYQWKRKKAFSLYTRRKLGKSLIELYSNRYEIRRLKEKNLLQLLPIKTTFKDIKSLKHYPVNNDYKELEVLSKYAFSLSDYSFVSIKKMLRATILDAWFSRNENSKEYFLHIKTNKEIQKYAITWWNKNGSKIQSGFDVAFLRYQENLERKLKQMDEKRNKNKASLMRKMRFEPNFTGFKRTTFLSEIEKGMSEKYWLSYRDRILKNEKKFLLNANINQLGFEEMLQMQGIQKQSLFVWSKGYPALELKSSRFEVRGGFDITNKSKLILIDSESGTYTSFSLAKDLVEFMNKPHFDMDFYYFYLPIMDLKNFTAFIVNGNDVCVAKNLKADDSTPIEFDTIPADLVNYRIIFKMLNKSVTNK